jgi:hypothetical protein
MPNVKAQRRLVKSPPELWTELSDAAALARHLGEFGEIRITRLEPETRVVWEGDRAAGSVRLDPAGWGTQVTLSVDVEAPEPVEPEPVAVEPEPEPEPDPDPEPEPEPEPEQRPVATGTPARAPMPARRGFLARLFAREDHVDTVIEAAREVVAVEPEPDAEPDPEPVAVQPEPAAVEPQPEPEPDRTAELLEHVLDQLGSAHHRPFSRA